MNNDGALGINYLGSESGYIITANVPAYAFGFISPDYPTAMYEADRITLMDLDTLGGDYSAAFSINESGQILGQSHTGLSGNSALPSYMTRPPTP